MAKLKETRLSKIISVAYTDAPFYDFILVYTLAVFNRDVRMVLKEYKHTAKVIRKNILVHAAERLHIRDAEYKEKQDSFIDRINYSVNHFIFNYTYKTAIATITFLIFITSTIIFNPFKTQNYSKEEIAIAKIQLGESLAIINKVFKNTGKNLDENIFNLHVNKPLNKLNTVSKILIGG